MKKQEQIACCYHCGDELNGKPIHYDDKDFCCDGCKMVYSLLKDSELCGYYDVDDEAQLKRKPVSAKQFEYLDTPEIAESFLHFSSENNAQVLFFIPDMHCSSCVWLLEKLYKLLPGIHSSRVNFDKKELHVSFNPNELSLRILVEKLSSLGYEPSLNTNSPEHALKSKSNAMLFRLGIAGFCMGNIMLFSFPEYLGMDEQSIKDFALLFRILSLALALPVVFYSAWPFFVSAWKGIRSKNLNIDFPLALGISTLFIRSLYEIFVLSSPGYLDSLSALVFFLLVGRWMQDKAYEGLSFDRDYTSYFPVAVQVKSPGSWIYKSLNEIKVGDFIRIRNNELIPADSRLISGNAHIDYSFVNGESQTQKAETNQRVYAGGRQIGPLLELEVLKPVSQSYLTSLWNQHSKEDKQSNIQSFSDLVGKWFTAVLLVLAIITFAYWLPIDSDKAFKAFTAVLIVACPCVLVIAAPFAFGNAMRWLGKRNIYLKNLDVVEKVAKIDSLAFDKTGTLSETHQKALIFLDKSNDEEKTIIRSLASCSSHPNSRLLFDSLKEYDFEGVDNFKEHAGKGVEAWISDRHVQIGSASWLGIDDENEGGTYVVIDGISKLGIKSKVEYRAGLDQLFRTKLKSFKKYLYSGDNDKERENLKAWFSDENMHFGLSPQQKEDAILQLRSKGERVMMLGDGLNDAGALRSANVGVAITEDVTNFTPASDVIMVGKSVFELSKFIEFCKQTVRVVHGSFIFSLIYNSIWMVLAIRGDLYPLVAALLMPISSITVFTINTIGIRYFASKGGIT